MKQFDIINAYNALDMLGDNKSLSKQEQWGLYKLRVMLRPHMEFQKEQEDKIRRRYVEFVDETGMLHDEKAQEFVDEMKAIGEIEIDIGDINKPQIRMADGISFKIIEPLEDFVEFLPPDDE